MMSLEGIKQKESNWDLAQRAHFDQYVKKQTPMQAEQTQSYYANSIRSLNSENHKHTEKIESVGLKEQKKGFFDPLTDWIKDKWNSFLEFIGVRKKTADNSIERDRKTKAKILQRHSPLDIEDDFKYLDITTMDPLKVMLAILVKQGKLQEEQVSLIQQKILLYQDDLKSLHDERMKVHAQLALIDKRSNVLEKVDVVVSVGQVIAGIASTAGVVATAATIATGGAAAPLVIVMGVVNGAIYGFQAFNTWLRADTKEKMGKLQGEMLTKTGKQDGLQFQMKVDVKDMKRVLSALTGQAEIGSSLLSAQYGK